MASYLTLAQFKSLSTMPSASIDELENVLAPGWIDAQLELVSADIDARLRKRYAAPFSAPVPLKVRAWVARIVTREAFLKRGIDPTDRQFETIDAAATKADQEITEAADSEKGLFDLPLREDTTATGISRGGPYGYSEASPYVGFDQQAEIGRGEDAAGRGSGD